MIMNLNKRPRYNTPVFKQDQPDDNYKFQPLPQPTGLYPFHLNIYTVIPAISTQKMVFHMVGDTGSLRNPDFTRLVANAMAKQCESDATDQPQFLYHLGDVVYNHGEATEKSLVPCIQYLYVRFWSECFRNCKVKTKGKKRTNSQINSG